MQYIAHKCVQWAFVPLYNKIEVAVLMSLFLTASVEISCQLSLFLFFQRVKELCGGFSSHPLSYVHPWRYIVELKFLVCATGSSGAYWILLGHLFGRDYVHM